MKYAIDYLFLEKGAKKPVDVGVVDDVVIETGGFGLVPAVGDYVDVPSERMGDRPNSRGIVRRRKFRYVLGTCYITIVIEEADEPN